MKGELAPVATFAAIVAAASVALLLIVPAALAKPQMAQHWVADSTTAMSITGDVRFARITPATARITFVTGASLPLQFVTTVPGLTWMPGDDGTAPADLYRITKPRNPRLLRDNSLCGTKAPTWLSVARKDGEIFLTLYDTDAQPTPKPDVSCAGFDYSPQK